MITEFSDSTGCVTVKYSYPYDGASIDSVLNIKVPIVDNLFSESELIKSIEFNIPYVNVYVTKQLDRTKESLLSWVGKTGTLAFDENKIVSYNDTPSLPPSVTPVLAQIIGPV